MIVQSFKSLTKFELMLWIFSVLSVVASFFISGSGNFLTLIASLIGVTDLIFVSKGNVLGQILTVIFAIFYGIISFSFRYYGEMITYLGMTAPLAILAVISWTKNPFEKGKMEVAVNKLKAPELCFMYIAAIFVTIAFYFILKVFKTNNLFWSTVSITTSFLASYLTLRRSPFYALAYAFNDIILIVLWILATIENKSYLSMVCCFLMFLINDLYGLFYWLKMRKRQNENCQHLISKNNMAKIEK